MATEIVTLPNAGGVAGDDADWLIRQDARRQLRWWDAHGLPGRTEQEQVEFLRASRAMYARMGREASFLALLRNRMARDRAAVAEHAPPACVVLPFRRKA